MIATAVWIAAALLIWAAVFGVGLWWLTRRLDQTRRLPMLPSPLAILEDRVAAGLLSRPDFGKLAARLHRHGIDR